MHDMENLKYTFTELSSMWHFFFFDLYKTDVSVFFQFINEAGPLFKINSVIQQACVS